ncbi:MAG TPA: peptidoglycan -binding protein [Stellaceae bacterium]|nr:peptidoglycan -binding protein [Stellaceae bacterium]
MPLARSRHRRPSIDIWPGFVDALAQLLIVIIFILLVFTAGQFFLSNALSGSDKALKELQAQVSQLGDLLSLEQSHSASLKAQLTATLAERDRLNARIGELTARAAAAAQSLSAQQKLSAAAQAQVDTLTASIAALRQQLAQIAAALDASQTKVKSQELQIADLGKKLNLALATKVQELARYRSEFFGKLRQIIGNRPDIHIVGDRFVFQSEVLFQPGKADLSDAAKKQLDPVVTVLKQIAAQIPPDLNWVLQVNGHTDHTPIHNAQFASNWELSTERAISVVRYMISQGIPADRLAAAGFADTEPLDPAATPAAYQRNRRIELKLSQH